MSGGSEDTPHKQSIALTLRRLRTERKLTQSDVARETGISSSFLSLVEQGRSDITIGRLLRLAEFYEVELSDLLADEPGPEQNPVQIVRADPKNMIHSGEEGVDVFNLIPGSRSTLVATVGIHEPGGGVDVDNIHERESMLFVLSGEFAIAFADREPMRIRRGEGAILHSIAPYRVWNVSKRVGRILAIAARSATTP